MEAGTTKVLASWRCRFSPSFNDGQAAVRHGCLSSILRQLPSGIAVAVVVAARAHAIAAAGGAPLAAGVVPKQQSHAAWRGARQQVGVGRPGDQVNRVGGE
jgi:hypothetical protein